MVTSILRSLFWATWKNGLSIMEKYHNGIEDNTSHMANLTLWSCVVVVVCQSSISQSNFTKLPCKLEENYGCLTRNEMEWQVIILMQFCYPKKPFQLLNQQFFFIFWWHTPSHPLLFLCNFQIKFSDFDDLSCVERRKVKKVAGNFGFSFYVMLLKPSLTSSIYDW